VQVAVQQWSFSHFHKFYDTLPCRSEIPDEPENVVTSVFFKVFKRVSWLSFRVSTPFSLLQYVWYF